MTGPEAEAESTRGEENPEVAVAGAPVVKDPLPFTMDDADPAPPGPFRVWLRSLGRG